MRNTQPHKERSKKENPIKKGQRRGGTSTRNNGLYECRNDGGADRDVLGMTNIISSSLSLAFTHFPPPLASSLPPATLQTPSSHSASFSSVFPLPLLSYLLPPLLFTFSTSLLSPSTSNVSSPLLS